MPDRLWHSPFNYLKNFFLKEWGKIHLDWDGLIERLCLTYIIVEAPVLGILIPFIILIKIFYRILILGFIPSISQTSEPGAASQKVLLKAEMTFDFIVSPAFAILVGVIFK